MGRVADLRDGETGFIGTPELGGSVPHWVPCIARSIATTKAEIRGQALTVYRNPETHNLEINIPDGHKLRQLPESGIAPLAFIPVVLVDNRGRKHEITPEDRREKR